jgi:hypothetical protein
LWYSTMRAVDRHPTVRAKPCEKTVSTNHTNKIVRTTIVQQTKR